MHAPRTLTLVAILAALAGCSKKPPEPQFATSATSPGYATGYPAELGAVRTSYFDEEKVVGAATDTFSRFPDELDEPDWALVRSVVQQADYEGRSEAYAERFEKVDAIRKFYAEEKDELRQKVAGAVQYTAKKKKCEGDVGSSAAVALDKAFDERLTESLHDASDAHTAIDQHEEALGKKNVEALEMQADTISMTSYVASIGVVRTKLRLRRMLTEIEQVQGTLDRTIADLRAEERREDLDPEAKKRLEARRAAAENAKRRIDAEVTGARSLADEIEKRIEGVQEKYQKALTALLENIERRAGSSGKQSSEK